MEGQRFRLGNGEDTKEMGKIGTYIGEHSGGLEDLGKVEVSRHFGLLTSTSYQSSTIALRV